MRNRTPHKPTTALAGLMLTIIAWLSSNSSAIAAIAQLNFYDFMAQVSESYPSLRIAEMEVEKAKEQQRRIESTLGWMLNGSAAVTHDLSIIGTPSDQLSVAAGVQRTMQDGHSIALSGSYVYQDNSLSISPILPNPSHNTKLDLSYRIPLQQGVDNPAYNQELAISEQQLQSSRATHDQFRTSVAEQARNLFYSAAFTLTRMINAREAVERARRLKQYIEKNHRLGLVENTDLLQVNAQLEAKLAELKLLGVNWSQQRTAMNRLMEKAWDQELQPVYNPAPNLSEIEDTQLLYQKIRNFSPELRISESREKQADARLIRARDNYKDKLDLILSVGTRTSTGDSSSGTVSEEDLAGSIKLEYQSYLDDSGLDATVKQAQLDRHIAAQESRRLSDEVNYNSRSLLEELSVLGHAYRQYLVLQKTEKKKLDEAHRLYRTGRINTAELIRFENEYSAVELQLEQQKIEINSRLVRVRILSGDIWHELSNRKGVNK